MRLNKWTEKIITEGRRGKNPTHARTCIMRCASSISGDSPRMSAYTSLRPNMSRKYQDREDTYDTSRLLRSTPR